MTISDVAETGSPFDRRVLFIGGKGGVGKTTVASAFGLLNARRGLRCLLVSTDPAHSLGEIFNQRVGDRETRLSDNLWGLEIDADKAADRHIAEVKETMRSLVRPALFHEIDRQMDLARLAPGTTESALLERVTGLLAHQDLRYDRILFDTAPTGHTLKLLALPELIAAWTDGLLKRRTKTSLLQRVAGQFNRPHGTGPIQTEPGDEDTIAGNERDDRIREILETRGKTYKTARKILLDRTISGFIPVVIPEKLPIQETRTALGTLKHHGIEAQALVINRVLPSSARGDFIENRRRQQRRYLQEIHQTFSTLAQISIDWLDHDVYGVQALDRIADQIEHPLGQ